MKYPLTIAVRVILLFIYFPLAYARGSDYPFISKAERIPSRARKQAENVQCAVFLRYREVEISADNRDAGYSVIRLFVYFPLPDARGSDYPFISNAERIPSRARKQAENIQCAVF